MAPVPSETCSVCETPMDGSVTVPTTVNRWVSGHRGDRGHREGLSAGVHWRLAGGKAILEEPPGELPRHVPADTNAEVTGEPRGQHDLVGGPGRRQVAGQHRHLVLAEVLAVQAAGDPVRQEAGVGLAADDRRGVEAQPRGARGYVWQVLDVLYNRQDRARHVDHDGARVDRGQVPAVGGVRSPRPGERCEPRPRRAARRSPRSQARPARTSASRPARCTRRFPRRHCAPGARGGLTSGAW